MTLLPPDQRITSLFYKHFKQIQMMTESEIFCDACIESSDAEHENSWETQLNATGTLSW